MINRRCPNPECGGSTNTYAVPSRAIVKVAADGKVDVDSNGIPVKIMCRRCRNCGQDYFDDGKGIPRIPKGEMGELMRKLQQARGIPTVPPSKEEQEEIKK
jgi:hypothetical protein